MCFWKANKNQKIICGALQGSVCTGGCCKTCSRKEGRGIEKGQLGSDAAKIRGSESLQI